MTNITFNLGYPYGVPDLWIGGSDMANHTNWVWSRGTPIDCIGCYTNWAPNIQGSNIYYMQYNTRIKTSLVQHSLNFHCIVLLNNRPERPLHEVEV